MIAGRRLTICRCKQTRRRTSRSEPIADRESFDQWYKVLFHLFGGQDLTDRIERFCSLEYISDGVSSKNGSCYRPFRAPKFPQQQLDGPVVLAAHEHTLDRPHNQRNFPILQQELVALRLHHREIRLEKARARREFETDQEPTL